MSRDRETVWSEPTLDDVIGAGGILASRYWHRFSRTNLGEEEHQLLSDQETEQKLLELAEDIVDGTVTSHAQVAKIVRGLNPRIGPMGSATTKIDIAAFKVNHALTEYQATFSDYDPQ